MHLEGEAIQWLSRTVRDVYSAATFEELHRQIIPALHDRFGSSCSACETASGDGSQYATQRICGNMRLPPDYAEFLWDNPNVQRLLSGRKERMLHLRQAVARADYERTDFYNVLARPNGFADQILTVVWRDRNMTIFTIHRDRLFTARERVLLEILQEHLAAALRRVAATTFPSSDTLAAP